MSWLSKAWRAVRSLWTSNRDVAVEVLTNVNQLIDGALPIVEDLDKNLKPKLDESKQSWNTILREVYEYAKSKGGIDATEAEIVFESGGAGVAYGLSALAVYILKSKYPEAKIPLSIARLTIEFAYNIYKLKRDAANASRDKAV